MDLIIHDIQHYVGNHTAQVAVTQKIGYYAGTAIVDEAFKAELFCSPRQEDGWLEWQLVFSRNGRAIIMGMIQRGPDEPFEFHS